MYCDMALMAKRSYIQRLRVVVMVIVSCPLAAVGASLCRNMGKFPGSDGVIDSIMRLVSFWVAVSVSGVALFLRRLSLFGFGIAFIATTLGGLALCSLAVFLAPSMVSFFTGGAAFPFPDAAFTPRAQAVPRSSIFVKLTPGLHSATLCTLFHRVISKRKALNWLVLICRLRKIGNPVRAIQQRIIAFLNPIFLSRLYYTTVAQRGQAICLL